MADRTCKANLSKGKDEQPKPNWFGKKKDAAAAFLKFSVGRIFGDNVWPVLR